MCDTYTPILTSKPHNLHYLSRYVKFITRIRSGLGERSDRFEAHHVCPKAQELFPQYTKSDWNIVKMSPREHFVAHHLLWKTFPSFRSMQYAFFKMNYSVEKGYVGSRTYVKLRLEMADHFVAMGKMNFDKMMAVNTGSKWYNNGTEERRLKQPEPGWIIGKLKRTAESYSKQGRPGLKYYNNGIENRKFSDPPNDSWKPGMKPRKQA